MRVVGVVERLQTRPRAKPGPTGEYSAIIPLVIDLAYPQVSRCAPSRASAIAS